MNFCVNHPDKKALSVCHNCGKYFCKECLVEGSEYYYCKKPECQEAFRKESPLQSLPSIIECPNCKSEIELSEEEKIALKFLCPVCDEMIDLSSGSSKVLVRNNFVELLSSFNQGDIALIKSLLEDANINYYVFGENFLGADPLLQPARFFIDESKADQAKELLKDFDFSIFGVSKHRYEE